MNDNVIEFKRKEEELPPEEEGQLLVNIRINSDGSHSVWISDSVVDPDEIDWVKEHMFNAMFTLGEALEERDDRYVERGPIVHKNEDELDD